MTTSAPPEQSAAVATPDAGPGVPPWHRRWLFVTHSLLSVIAIGLAIWLGLLLSQRSTVNRQAAMEQSALAAATHGVATFTTFDYRHLSQEFADLQSELTGPLLASLKKTEPELRSRLTAGQDESIGTVQAAAVASISANTATVIVVASLAYQPVAGPVDASPQVDRLVVSLVRAHGGWLLDNAKAVP